METGNYFEDNESKPSKKLTPERVVNILEKHGTKVSVEEAGIILQFMRKVADVAVNQYLSAKKD